MVSRLLPTSVIGEDMRRRRRKPEGSAEGGAAAATSASANSQRTAVQLSQPLLQHAGTNLLDTVFTDPFLVPSDILPFRQGQNRGAPILPVQHVDMAAQVRQELRDEGSSDQSDDDEGFEAGSSRDEGGSENNRLKRMTFIETLYSE